MADSNVKDPMAMWRDLVSQWEKGINSLANQTMASDEYSGSMNQAMNLTLRMQKTTGEMMAGYLTALNLPSKADVAQISERLFAIETSLDRIARALEASAEDKKALPEPVRVEMPPRTKRAPAKSAT